MSDDQIDRLFDILDTEKRKLEELDAKYEEEVREINEKHFIEWQTLKAKEQERRNCSKTKKKMINRRVVMLQKMRSIFSIISNFSYAICVL